MGRRLVVEAASQSQVSAAERPARSSGAISSRRVLPERNGASQPGSAASASSERSGHARLGPAQKHDPVAPLLQRGSTAGERAQATGRRAPERAPPPRPAGQPASVRRARAPRAGAAAAPEATRRRGRSSVRLRSRSTRRRFASISASESGAARRMRAEAARPAISPMARNGSVCERVMRLDRRRPPVRHQEFAAPPAGDRDAVRVG